MFCVQAPIFLSSAVCLRECSQDCLRFEPLHACHGQDWLELRPTSQRHSDYNCGQGVGQHLSLFSHPQTDWSQTFPSSNTMDWAIPGGLFRLAGDSRVMQGSTCEMCNKAAPGFRAKGVTDIGITVTCQNKAQNTKQLLCRLKSAGKVCYEGSS